MASRDVNSSETFPTADAPVSSTTFLVYVDDSGDEDHDLLAALCIPIQEWANVLITWKKYRSWVERWLKLPPTVELHGVDLLGRGVMQALDHVTGEEHNIPEVTKYSTGKQVRRSEVFQSGLASIGSCVNCRLLVCYEQAANGTANLYERVLVPWLNEWLATERSWGVVWYDGTDLALIERHKATHRNLPLDRRVIEDASHQLSHHSHFLQMADLCVHGAYKTIRGDQGNETRPEVTGAYSKLDRIIVPGNFDKDGFPAHSDPRGIRGYPT